MRLNIQAMLREELEGRLPDAVVGVSVPNPRPGTFVLVRREGGRMLDAHRDSAGAGVFCWAPTEAEAADLACRASQAMLSLEHIEGIASVEEEILSSAPDTEDGSPRWYGSYTLITYKQRSR